MISMYTLRSGSVMAALSMSSDKLILVRGFRTSRARTAALRDGWTSREGRLSEGIKPDSDFARGEVVDKFMLKDFSLNMVG